jgi:hypothetical protein
MLIIFSIVVVVVIVSIISIRLCFRASIKLLIKWLFIWCLAAIIGYGFVSGIIRVIITIKSIDSCERGIHWHPCEYTCYTWNIESFVRPFSSYSKSCSGLNKDYI